MNSFQECLDDISKLRETLEGNNALGSEELVIIAYTLGSLHANVLERIEPGLSKKRRFSYSSTKGEKDRGCECGGKQKPKYLLEDPKRYVCQRCYSAEKKNKKKT